MQNNYNLRLARKMCRMSIGQVAGAMGATRKDLIDWERGTQPITKPNAAALWDFYEKNEQPPRFEGQKTVYQLRQEWEKNNGN